MIRPRVAFAESPCEVGEEGATTADTCIGAEPEPPLLSATGKPCDCETSTLLLEAAKDWGSFCMVLISLCLFTKVNCRRQSDARRQTGQKKKEGSKVDTVPVGRKTSSTQHSAGNNRANLVHLPVWTGTIASTQNTPENARFVALANAKAYFGLKLNAPDDHRR